MRGIGWEGKGRIGEGEMGRGAGDVPSICSIQCFPSSTSIVPGENRSKLEGLPYAGDISL